MLQILALLCTLLVGAAALGVIVTQTTWFKDWLRGFIVRQADDYLHGDLTIGRLGGNLFFGVELENVDLQMDGQPVIRIKDVGLDYNFVNFITTGIVLDELRLNQPFVRLERTEEGWNLGRLVKAQRREADREGPARPISIGSIGISDGTVVIEGVADTGGVEVPSRIDRLDATIGFEYEPVDFTVDIGHVSFRTADPALTLTQLSGRIAAKDDTLHVDDLVVRTAESSLRVDGTVGDYQSQPRLSLRASSDTLTLDEIARVIPALGSTGLRPAFTLEASGPLERLALGFEARSEAGNVRADLTADVTGPERRFDGTVAGERVNVAPFMGEAAQPSDITARARVDLRLTEAAGDGPLDALSGTYAVDAPQVSIMGYHARNVAAKGRIEAGVVHLDGSATAYGGRASVRGTVAPARPLRLDLRGEAAGLDLRNLPASLNVPGVPSDLNASYHVRGTVGDDTDLVVDTTFRRSRLAGAAIEAGGTARVHMAGRALSYAADLAVRGLDLTQVGEGFGIEALADERYASTINGTFAVSGRGTSLEALVLDARGELVDSSLFGGQLPSLTFDAGLNEGALRLVADGSFGGFDPAALTGRSELGGTVGGTVDVEVQLAAIGEPIGPESIAAQGTVRLAESQVGELSITQATIDGMYANRRGEIRRLHITGPDITVEASGPLDLTETGTSRVAYEAHLTDLSAVGRMLDQPLSGSVSTEGQLTGNANALRAGGTLQASNLHHGENTALAIDSEYQVELPGLDVARVHVEATTTASLLQVAGQELTQLEARTTYSGDRLAVEATLEDPRRTLDVSANIVLHTDHQEVHVSNLGFRTEGIEWRTAAGSEAAIQYGENRVVVDGLRLVSDGQQLAVDGALGQPGDELRVNVSSVQMAGLNALALGEQRVEGILDATATVRGTMQEPRVDAQFTVAQGAFSAFTYSSLGGTVQYGAEGLQFDTRLAQTADAWITARGTLPAAFFAPQEESADTSAAVHEEPAPGEGVDIVIESSPLDLAIVQGFVPQLSEVSGTLQTDVRITGTRRDPHFDGYVDIRNGSFTIAELTPDGYTGLDTRIALGRDRVSIQEFRVLDEHDRPLTVSGELALHARQVGEMAIAVRADRFEVIDNELADVKLNADLRITGELTAPRVEGDLSIATGTIDVGRVLEFMAAEPYALRATSVEGLEGLGTLTPPDSTETDDAGSDLPMLEPTATPPSVPAAVAEAVEPADDAATGAFDALALDVRLTVPNNLVVRGRDLRPGGSSPIGLGDVNVTLGGDVRATKAPGEDVRLLGSINTVRGTYTFQGRRFDIERDGRVQFTGGTEFDPRLDITATRLISGVEVSINIRGTARDPQLNLSSSPPQDEADILSLIIFNQPVNALGEGQQVSLAQRASALATGFVASTLAQSLGQALELDIFEIETTPERGGSPTVTIGEQVGERLFFRFRQAFGAQSVSEFILEYQLADFLRLQTAVAEGSAATARTLTQRVERAGVDLIFFFTY
jgi:translocation and assembly module TamB